MYFAQELQPGFGAALLALLQSCGEALLAQVGSLGSRSRKNSEQIQCAHDATCSS